MKTCIHTNTIIAPPRADASSDTAARNDSSECAPVLMVIHASVGSGHKSAANAISEALNLLKQEHDQLIPNNLEIETIDILTWGRHKFNGDKAASYFVGATRPIYDLLWRYTFTGRVLWGGGTIWSHIMYAPFTRYIAKRKPIACICTHITAANAAVSARMLCKQNFPIVCVPTDYETEGLWPHLHSDMFCIASEAMAETLRARKVSDARIALTGIPTREDFRLTHDIEQTRKTLQLPSDKTLVLVLAGAAYPTPYLRFRDTLDALMPHVSKLNNMHFIFVAGKDEEYRAHLEQQLKTFSLTNACVFGYVKEMAALMSASNLVICKSGGLTVTECLCTKVPMILVGRAYGQEKINTEMLTNSNAAMHVTTPRELLDVLHYLMTNPHGLDAMLVNGAIIRHPHAARDIAHIALELYHKQRTVPPEVYQSRFAHFYLGHKPAHVR